MSDIQLTLAGAISASHPEVDTPGGNPQSETIQAFQLVEDLSPEDQAQADACAERLDLHDSLTAVKFGRSLQNQLRHLATSVLELVGRHDISEVGKLLTGMVASISGLTSDEPKSTLRDFFKPAKSPETLQMKYAEVSEAINRQKKQLDGWYDTLLVDIQLLDKKLQQLHEYYRQLKIHITAGQRKLATARSIEIETLRQKASATQAQADIAQCDEFISQCNAFDARLQDLVVTKTSCQQMMLQVQLTRNTYKQLAQKIQSSTSNAISVWQNSISTALTIRDGQKLLKLSNTKLLATLDDALVTQREASEGKVKISQL